MIRISRRIMGCSFTLHLMGDDPRYLTDAAQEALDEAERIEQQLSLFRPDSEISFINARAATEPVRVEPRLFELLLRAQELSAATDGAFNLAVGSLMRVWGFHEHAIRLPEESELATLLEGSRAEAVELSDTDGTIFFRSPGIRLDPGAIGKGWAVDRIAEMLRERGIESALIDAGTSTVYAIGAPPGEEHWKIGIRHPLDPQRTIVSVGIRDGALSTSAGYEQFLDHHGRRYGHIMDPRTGRPADGILSASAITTSATDSDALSTAFFVNGLAWTKRYCRGHAGIGAIMIPCSASKGEPSVMQFGIMPTREG